MDRTRMHPDEILTDVGLVRALVDGQFPRWRDRPLTFVLSYGTDHDVYRLGDDLSVRLPRTAGVTAQAELEATWLPRLAPCLPLALPVRVAAGEPAEGYPFPWSVDEWLPGDDLNHRPIADRDQAAVDLAAFVLALRGIDITGAFPRERGRRGSPLVELDRSVRHAVGRLGDRVDGAAALWSWEESLSAPAHVGPGTWLHGDLLQGNLMVLDGRLSGVIDWGGLNVGDPACDLQPGWNLFDGPSRARFRAELEVDDGAWLRGRGWVLAQTVIAMPYYWHTNPGIIAQTRHGLAEVLADSG